MADTPELPPRPEPPRRFGDTIAAWLAWFGLGRLIASAVCVLVVLGGVAWLVRVPAPATEAGLPLAAASSSGTATPTLPPPSTLTPPPTAPVLNTVIVHVAGAVVRPGIYPLDGDERVHAAIEAAGGATPAADLNGLNLAAGLADGQRVYVPVEGEVDPSSVPAGGGSGVGAGSDDDSSPASPVDLNVATASELETLPGIGPATAAAIVVDRERNGPFASVSDLERVPGIGPAKLAAVADLVTV